ncbi:hypothetical protein E8E13_004687 [Curvularia kusanoi]|uniref:Uncharacterized protein n=1 Tax=Curvularia kusanoi TaxID=90978 RepID=A0A9P4TAW2_CURKU|nr:hypothetical protein E8E13_004687 [Curvularia kusanoi]
MAAAATFHNTRPERVVFMPAHGHDDEPDLPARTRKPETIHAMPDAPLVQLQSSCPVRSDGAHSLALLHPSRATLAAFVSSHSQPQFPESAVASFYLLDAGLSFFTARPRSARVSMAQPRRRWAAAACMQPVDAQ